MNISHNAVDAAIRDADRLRNTLKRSRNAQVRTTDERVLVKATALTWFNDYREKIAARLHQDDVDALDGFYRQLLAGSDRAMARSTYDAVLRSLRNQLISARTTVVAPPVAKTLSQTTDIPPNFSSLIANPTMQAILARRWTECSRCIAAKAPLAATVMMGGLLEGLLLAKINSQPQTTVVFTAKSAPRDQKTGNPLGLPQWTLKNYIDVAHELRWISQSARDIGVVLRDYRNYVHPQKELSHGIVLSDKDALLLWEVSKSVARQLL
jgi:hypothetical protein